MESKFATYKSKFNGVVKKMLVCTQCIKSGRVKKD